MLARRTFLRSGAAALGGALLASRFANAQAARIATTDLGGAWLFQGAGGNVVALQKCRPEDAHKFGIVSLKPTANPIWVTDGLCLASSALARSMRRRVW